MRYSNGEGCGCMSLFPLSVLAKCSAELTTLLLKADPLNKKMVELHYSILVCLELVTNLHLDPIRLFSVFDVWVWECFGSNLEEELVEKKGSPSQLWSINSSRWANREIATVWAKPHFLYFHDSPLLDSASTAQGESLGRLQLYEQNLTSCRFLSVKVSVLYRTVIHQVLKG